MRKEMDFDSDELFEPTSDDSGEEIFLEVVNMLLLILTQEILVQMTRSFKS